MADHDRGSLARAVVFWWGLLLVVQQVQRLSLLLGAAAQEIPAAGVLLGTLVTGLRADLVTASFGIVAALVVALLLAAPVVGLRRLRGVEPQAPRACLRALGVAATVVTVVCVAVLTVDLGYYRYSQHRLDLVFFEYVGDVVEQLTRGASGTLDTQAGRQTAAEVRDLGRWLVPVGTYLALEVLAIATWRLLFRRWIARALDAGLAMAPRAVAGGLALAVAAGAWGLHPSGPESVQAATVSDSTYYVLSQNPVWYAGAAVRRTMTRKARLPEAVLALMPEDRALRTAPALLAPTATFLDPRYPMVRQGPGPGGHALARRPNVLLIFVEALDHRFLGRSVDGVRVSPFLDELAADSVSFGGFLTNGVQTFHGLYASLCSALPRHGVAATKARYANDYLCLPSLLKRAGYRTALVIGQNRDRNHSNLGLFLARNGLDELIDEPMFPADQPRLGLGVTDGALFERLGAEVRRLRAEPRPWLLATLTTGTHHPFVVPVAHPEVKALGANPDRYLHALRYLDLELGRFVTGLRREGLLRDTVIVLLGDHGRHENFGLTSFAQRAAGHFQSPLLVWVDPSLRTADGYRPRRVPGLVSQVDLTPTILGLAGLGPRVSPFAGEDLSCTLARDCVPDRTIYLSNVYDNAVGIADRDGFWFYSLESHRIEHTTLDLARPSVRSEPTDPAVAARVERVLALYVSSMALIERNKLWSSREFGPRL